MKQLNETKPSSTAKLQPVVKKEYMVDPDWDEIKHGELDFMRIKNGESY